MSTAAGKLQPILTPVTSQNLILFLTTLPASKAAGVAAIRVSRVTAAAQVEELNADADTIVGFLLKPVVDASTKQVTGIAVTQMGGSDTPEPFTPTQQAAFALMTSELKQFQAANDADAAVGEPAPPPKDRELKSTAGWILGLAVYVLDCGAAIGEGGANPLADAACIATATDLNISVYEGGDDDEPTAPPEIDIPSTEEAGTSYTTTSQDGVDDPVGTPSGPSGGATGGNAGTGDGSGDGGDGGDGGDAGSGGGPGIDDKPGHAAN